VLFCPTRTSAGNLAAEGILDGVHVTGDVMYDATVYFCAQAEARDADRPPGAFYVATVHRAENTDRAGRLASIVEAFGRLPGPVIFPVHPRTRKGLDGLTLPSNVELRSPQSYLSMLRLVKEAKRVLTDSGGLQKEAVWLGTPCVTLRAETEWVETLVGGWNILADADPDRIESAVLASPEGPPPAVGVVDGLSASRRVASILART
jgi:UDP-N-acetylglucosamine 2-epimerase